MYRTRQWRRAQNKRILKNYAKFMRLTGNDLPIPGMAVFWYDRTGRWRAFNNWEDVNEYRARRARFNCNTRVMCSGICCGNPRRWFNEVTRQELKSEITFKEQD
jgi:hypothetical protein